jgi:hypothetical protein
MPRKHIQALFGTSFIACLVLSAACGSDIPPPDSISQPRLMVYKQSLVPENAWLHANEEQTAITVAILNTKGTSEPLPADAEWSFSTTVDGQSIDMPFVFAGYGTLMDYTAEGWFTWRFTPPITGEYSISATVNYDTLSATSGLELFTAYPFDTPFSAKVLDISGPGTVGSKYSVTLAATLNTEDGREAFLPVNAKWTFHITADGVEVDVPAGPPTAHVDSGLNVWPIIPPVAGNYSLTATVKYGSQSSTSAPYVFTVREP